MWSVIEDVPLAKLEHIVSHVPQLPPHLVGRLASIDTDQLPGVGKIIGDDEFQSRTEIVSALLRNCAVSEIESVVMDDLIMDIIYSIMDRYGRNSDLICDIAERRRELHDMTTSFGIRREQLADYLYAARYNIDLLQTLWNAGLRTLPLIQHMIRALDYYHVPDSRMHDVVSSYPGNIIEEGFESFYDWMENSGWGGD